MYMHRDCSKKPAENEPVQHQSSSKNVARRTTQQSIARSIAIPIVNPWLRRNRANDVQQLEKPWRDAWPRVKCGEMDRQREKS